MYSLTGRGYDRHALRSLQPLRLCVSMICWNSRRAWASVVSPSRVVALESTMTCPWMSIARIWWITDSIELAGLQPSLVRSSMQSAPFGNTKLPLSRGRTTRTNGGVNGKSAGNFTLSVTGGSSVGTPPVCPPTTFSAPGRRSTTAAAAASPPAAAGELEGCVCVGLSTTSHSYRLSPTGSAVKPSRSLSRSITLFSSFISRSVACAVLASTLDAGALPRLASAPPAALSTGRGGGGLARPKRWYREYSSILPLPSLSFLSERCPVASSACASSESVSGAPLPPALSPPPPLPPLAPTSALNALAAPREAVPRECTGSSPSNGSSYANS
mmetsp:Transcript_6855/g.17533  ORF Transcript_6855/g.17533 Transcript_6855/m.17533 type:complete len:329 (-) Transcript_6855:543-1529(-)